MCIVFCGKYQLATLGRYGSGRGDFWACYPCRWKRKKVARWEGCVRVVAGSRGKVLGDAWARQCGRQQSQALCKVVVRVFCRDLAEAGARRGEWLLLDGLRLGTGIVGSGPLSCALFSGTSEP